MDISVIVPLYNEAESLPELEAWIKRVMDENNFSYEILFINDGSTDFSQWKADIWAVDLNVNFPALWGGGSQNVFCPSPYNWVGYYPASEREVRVLMDLTNNIRPDITLSYHTKGNVIYYGFEQLTPEEIARDKEIADIISSINGYIPIKTENSTGGSSDWVSETYHIPAFTIEVGDASLTTPIPLSAVPDAIARNQDIPQALLNYLSTTSEPDNEIIM